MFPMEFPCFPPGDEQIVHLWHALFSKSTLVPVEQGYSDALIRGYKLRGLATLTLSLFSASA
jgi:hypothetical protein